MDKITIKRFLVYLNLGLFCMLSWYIVAELILTVIWRQLWH